MKFIDPSGHEPRFNGEVGNVYRWYYGSDLIWSSLKEPEPDFNIGALALEIQWLDVKGTEEEKLDLSLYVALFQANANLDVTGEIDPKTLDFLGKYGVLYLSEKNIGLDDWLIKRYKSSEKYKNERLRWVLEHPEEYYNYLSIKLSYRGLEWMGYIELGGALYQELKGILAARGLIGSVNSADDAVRFFDDLQRFSDEMVQGTGKARNNVSTGSFGKNTVGAAERYVPSNIKMVKDKYLKNKGIDAHALKQDFIGKKNIAHFDIYVDKDSGMLWIYRKGGIGEPIPTYEFIK